MKKVINYLKLGRLSQKVTEDHVTLLKLSLVMIILIGLVTSMFLSSCTTSGYGCKGRSKTITGIK
jgi:hypothetical protein